MTPTEVRFIFYMRRMKESWIDKLIELLNEYKIYTDHKNSRMSEYVWINVWDDIVMDSYVWTTKDKTLEIISKKFWFIKWLVDNEKIDTDIVYKKWFLAKTYDKDEVWEYFEPYEEILMLLAIQDEPIEFLVSILK